MVKAAELTCWKCGASLEGALLPFPRLAKCRACQADLHVCRMCEFYDTTVNNSCREPVAEKVNDKQHKNFCGYFQPSAGAFLPADTGRQSGARRQLDELFGIKDEPSAENENGNRSEAEQAKRKLDDLFNLDKKS